AIIGRHAGRNDLSEPEHRTIHDHTGARRLPYIVGELVAYEGPAVDFPKQVDYDHVIGLKHVNYSLVAQTPKTLLLRLRLHGLGYIGPCRHELNSEGAPDQFLAGIEDLP